MNCLSASVLSADFGKLAEDINTAVEAGVDYIHLDVMDGMFVPNITIGIPVISALRKYSDKIFDVHLMIEDPGRYIKDFADAGADIITVHAEACTHLDRVIDSIKECGVMAGVALNPATPVSMIEHILPKCDMVLIMTVNPGFGGQKFIPYTLDKIREVRELIESMSLKTDIEVDGGIDVNNVESVIDAGANIIVSGSAVFKGDITKNVTAFMDKL